MTPEEQGGEVYTVLRSILEARIAKNPTATSVRYADHRCKAIWYGLGSYEQTLRMDVYLPGEPGPDPEVRTFYEAVMTRYVTRPRFDLAAAAYDHVQELHAVLERERAT